MNITSDLQMSSFSCTQRKGVRRLDKYGQRLVVGRTHIVSVLFPINTELI